MELAKTNRKLELNIKQYFGQKPIGPKVAPVRPKQRYG